jgi:PAS domain S-box-containing protein
MSERRYRLLVVEDSPEDRAAYRRALAGGEEPFEVEEAEAGAAGLARCREAAPDCVLLDNGLPDMDAVEFLESLKGGRSEPPVPVVVVTGQGSESLAVRAMRAGAHDYLVKGAPAADIRRAVRAAMERQARLPDRPYRVLILDDSPEDRAAYRRRLSHGPDRFEFREAETGEEGLALFGQFRPDCVLLDYQLPDTDGIEVLAQLARECGGELPAVVVLTGQGNERVAVRALKAGAEDYLVKGPGLETLPQAVRSAVEKVALRHRVEEQRRELERHRNQLRVTLASIGDAVIATDPQGGVTFLNAVAERLTGWPTDEARGRPLPEVFAIINQQTRRPVENPALRALREGAIVGLANHTVLVARDGAERPIDDSAAPIRDENGVVYGSVLVFRDVTDRYRAEQSLLLQSRVLESMAEGVSVADESGVIFYTNPAEDRMFGYERGGLVGLHVTQQNDYPPEENARRVNEVIAQLKAGGAWTGEWRNRRKDGSVFTTHARITRLDVGGRGCFVCVQEDVSERHRLEDELQCRVNELALADRRKDEFLAMLAHELRNPLAPIKNALHVLKLRSGDWQTVDRVREMMERQVGHMGRLIDDLLDVSRITQGKIKLKLERLDLARLARECAADHRAEFEAARVALSVAAPETPVWVTGDATRLTQVVDNFLTNALKFTNPDGRVALAVGAAGGRATLSVRDTGIGIEPEFLPTIFDVFAQADKSLDRSRGGMGLGLAIVKGLVELHGGAVAARSEGLGRGTEMLVELPVEPEPQALSPAAGRRAGAGRPMRVLVVEDSRDSAESLRLLLEATGHEVRLAHSGDEGVRAALEWHPDAVVCDIGLPGMDGFAVARQLRRHPATAGVMLVAVTGYGRAEDAEKARESGFDDHLVKPADPGRLLEKLEQANRGNR